MGIALFTLFVVSTGRRSMGALHAVDVKNSMLDWLFEVWLDVEL